MIFFALSYVILKTSPESLKLIRRKLTEIESLKDRSVRSFQSAHDSHDYKLLPKNILDAMKPIYNHLSKDSLHERCVGGFTQNNNESLNQLIWKISPKIMSSEAISVELAANIAADALFNEGLPSLLFFQKSIGVNLDHNFCRRVTVWVRNS